MATIYWNTVKVGDNITPYSKPPISRTQIAKFAGATEDFGPQHVDDEFASISGFGGVFAHGLMSLGFAQDALRHFAQNMRVSTLSGTFEKLVWPGDVITSKGVIVKHYRYNGDTLIDIDLWAINQHADRVMQGKATCILWENKKREKSSKFDLPPITNATQKSLHQMCKTTLDESQEMAEQE